MNKLAGSELLYRLFVKGLILVMCTLIGVLLFDFTVWTMEDDQSVHSNDAQPTKYAISLTFDILCLTVVSMCISQLIARNKPAISAWIKAKFGPLPRVRGWLLHYVALWA